MRRINQSGIGPQGLGGTETALAVHVESFPWWDSFSALLSHLSFVRDHHKKVACVALATDSAIGGFAENIANHFVSAQIKRFAFNEVETAKKWIMDIT